MGMNKISLVNAPLLCLIAHSGCRNFAFSCNGGLVSIGLSRYLQNHLLRFVRQPAKSFGAKTEETQHESYGAITGDFCMAGARGHLRACADATARRVRRYVEISLA